MDEPAASVIVPSIDGARLAPLLASLARQTAPVEALVVDNASAGASVSRACEGHGFARAIRLERNAGFSRAVNLAAREARAPALILVNDDAECDPGFAAAISAPLDREAGTAMAAGVMRDGADPGLIDTAGVELDRTLLAFDYLNGEPLAALAGAPPPLGPSGAAAAFDREAFLEAGGFDERLFAYWEDVDLALRMRVRGWRCALAGDALGTHHHSATLGAGSRRKNYLMGFGRTYLLRKWGAWSARRALPVAAREVVICAGQLVLDRNAGGIAGRIAGARAPVAPRPYPAAALAASPAAGRRGSLGRRARRRLRLRAR